jgi:hypothetical protein
MSRLKEQGRSNGPPGALARPDWRAGGEFTASDLRLEHDYEEQRLRRHLRLVHGWGVVCGLTVVATGEDWYLCICPGYGVSPCGDEIVVPVRYCFNLRDYLWTRPLGRTRANVAWISVEAAESKREIEDSYCGCGECKCGHEKGLHEAAGFQVVVSWTQPVFTQSSFDVCLGGTPACPACPDTCALLLASVTLPPSNRVISGSAIANKFLRG